jgi:hypothetical protein
LTLKPTYQGQDDPTATASNKPNQNGPDTYYSSGRAAKAQAARDLALRYIELWSEPNRVSIPAAAAFYGQSVVFHGKRRDISSVIAEKRRFAQRWPDRSYHYRPGTTYVGCESNGGSCTVWSIFDFSARAPGNHRQARGIGEHELVVSFAGGSPIIISENSRVLLRGNYRVADRQY